MASKVNTLKSGINSTEQAIEKSYSVKYRKLEKWMSRNGYTHAEVAGILHIPLNEFYRKLWVHEPFEEEYIRRLITLLSAFEAINIIFFKSEKKRNFVYGQVFGEQ